MTGPFLLLHDADNVLVARTNAPEGLEVALERGPVWLARQTIAAGAHVHIHNIRSAYTPPA